MKERVTETELKSLANKLMFDLEDSEAKTLEGEFEVILKQMELIGNIPHISEYEPMTFPYVTYEYDLRVDEYEESLPVSDVLANAKDTIGDEIKVPKVVE